MSEIKPWERQPGESEKAYAAFCCYRDLEKPSIDQAFEVYKQQQNNSKTVAKQQRAGRYFNAWAKKFGWVERRTAFRDWIASERVSGMAEGIKERAKSGVEQYELDLIDFQKSLIESGKKQVSIANRITGILHRAIDEAEQSEGSDGAIGIMMRVAGFALPMRNFSFLTEVGAKQISDGLRINEILESLSGGSESGEAE